MATFLQKRIFIFFLLLFYGCSPLREEFRALDNQSRQSKAEKFILDNGLTVLTRQMPETSLVSIELLVKTGSATEGKYLGTGISHFIEHMLFKGGHIYKPGDIARQIKLLGGEIGGFTNYDYTGFTITVPGDNLDKALDILIDSVYLPSFDKDEFNKERRVILDEMRMNADDPGRRIFRLLRSNLYLKHPYRHPVIGYRKPFLGLTVEDLVNFHKEHYLPNNMLLSIAGNFDKELLLDVLKKKLSKFERGREIEPASVIENAPVSRRYYEEAFPTKLMYLSLGFPGVEVNDPDLFALDLLAMILGEGESSRLNTRLKREENLVYTISCFNYTPKDKGIFGISLTAEYKNKDAVMRETLAELEKIKTSLVKEEELLKVKNTLLEHFYRRQETVEGQSEELAADEFLTGDIDFSTHYIERIKQITPRDLSRVARKYLKMDNSVEVVLRPKELPATGRKTETVDSNTNEIEKIKLANGMVLLLKEEHKLPNLSLQMTFLGGLRAENRQDNGISNLCSELITKGTKYKTAQEIAELVENRGAILEPFSGKNSLGLSLNLLNKDAGFGIKILSDIVKNASFPKKELDKEKIQTEAKIRSISDAPFSYAFRLLKKNLFLKHPYGMDYLGELATVERLSRKNIREFYKRIILPSNCVMAVVGDFDREKIIKEVKANFSSWHPREKFKTFLIPEEPAIGSPRIYEQKTDKKQTILLIGYHAPSMHSPQYYTFVVLNELLGGHGNRLFEKVREQQGLAYAVGSSYVAGIEIGYFVYYAATKSDTLEKVKETIFNEIKEMQNLGFSDIELRRAKASIIGEHRRSLQTNDAFAFRSSLDELYGLGFDNYKKFEEMINAVSNEDLTKVVQRYFKPGNYCLVELIPE